MMPWDFQLKIETHSHEGVLAKKQTRYIFYVRHCLSEGKKEPLAKRMN